MKTDSPCFLIKREMPSGISLSLSKKSRPASAPVGARLDYFLRFKVAPSAHIGGCAPHHPQYIAKKHSAGGRGRVRQHPTSFPLPFGEGVRGWGKFKLNNTFLTD